MGALRLILQASVEKDSYTNVRREHPDMPVTEQTKSLYAPMRM